MKTSDHEQKLHLDGTEKPGFQKILACHGDFRNLRGGPRQRGDLDDEYFYGIAKNRLSNHAPVGDKEKLSCGPKGSGFRSGLMA
jgi:hypothetical protein